MDDDSINAIQAHLVNITEVKYDHQTAYAARTLVSAYRDLRSLAPPDEDWVSVQSDGNTLIDAASKASTALEQFAYRDVYKKDLKAQTFFTEVRNTIDQR